MRSLVIVPTYNEADNLPELTRELLALPEHVDLLVIDDNSPDGTGLIADGLAAALPDRVRVLHRPGKAGLGTAYVQGFRYALTHGYDRVVEMDADLSHRPTDLPRLLRAANSADVVIGSRNIPGGTALHWSPMRHAISKGGSAFVRLVLGVPIHDCTSGFKVFRRRALECLDLDALRSNGYAFQVEVNYACVRAGQRVVEVPIVFPDRRRGTSKMSWRIVLEGALMVLRIRAGRIGGANAPVGVAVARPRTIA